MPNGRGKELLQRSPHVLSRIPTTVGLLTASLFIAVQLAGFSHLQSRSLTLLESSNALDENSARQAQQSYGAEKETIAFIDVSVVPMDSERLLTRQTVIVKDGLIAEIAPTNKVRVPPSAQPVDGKNKYLMPGLADMHVHLHDFDEPTNRAMFQLFLANGVTTILNLYGTPHHLELRERIRRGELLGPVVYTSGPFVSDASVQTPRIEEVERAVIEHKRAGYDFIKIHGDFSREAYRKLFEVARREGIRVIGHAPRNLGIEVMLEERQDAIAHSEEYLYAYFYFKSEESIQNADIETKNRFFAKLANRIPAIAKATAKAGVWVIPNLTAYKGIGLQAKDIKPVLARPEVKYVPTDCEGLAAGKQHLRAAFQQRRRGVVLRKAVCAARKAREGIP